MDNHDKKGSGNAVLSSRAISVLVENIEKTIKSKGSLKECQELKTLKEKCCDENVCIAHCACQGIAIIAKKKLLNSSQTITLLISLLPSITHYPPLVINIGNILLSQFEEEIRINGKYMCEYNFTDRAHPFVIMLKHDTVKAWKAIFAYIHYLLHNNNDIDFSSKINVHRSFFLYVLCDPTTSSVQHKIELFSLLLEHLDRPAAKNLIIEGLAWQKMDMNLCWLVEKICRRLVNSIDKEDRCILNALTPFLASVIKWLVINGHNPVLWIELLEECLKINCSGASSVLYILSDVILDCPPLFVNQLVHVCEYIIYSLSCNRYVAQKFAAVSIIWMVNPSPFADPLFLSLDKVFKFLHVKLKSDKWMKKEISLSNNRYFKILRNSVSEIKSAVEMIEISDNWNEKISLLNWLNCVNTSNYTSMETSLRYFISGIFMYEDEEEILDVSSQMLLNLSKGNSELSFQLISLTFFKLCREIEPKKQLKYLRTLTKIGISKENVSFIIGILETLKNDQSKLILPVVIDLYLKLWKSDNRIYPYLHKTLFNSGDESWDLNVMKTIALREICRTSPETYGKNLVSKLSEILNDSDSCASDIPSAIAIEAVIELCKASVTDITGAWKALKPKLSRDKRRNVVISLCKLFGEVPKLNASRTEQDVLMGDIVPRLWNYAFSDDFHIAKASLQALANFRADSYGPKLLPDVLKSDLEIPKQYLKQSGELSRQEILDQLDYVPGECWVELLQRIDVKIRKDAGNMIQSLIMLELNSLPRRFFCHPEQVPEPVDYKHLPQSSICRTLVFHVKKFSDSSGDGEKVASDSLVECLRILSGDYLKSFPVLDWSFLENFFRFGGDCKKYSVIILAKQGISSKGGRKAFENYIVSNYDKFEDVNDFIYLYAALPYVCYSLSANTLNLFLSRTIRTTLNFSVKSNSNHFEKVLDNARITLESKLVPDPRKALLLTQIQNILPQVPPNHPVMKKYAVFLASLPSKAVEDLTTLSSRSKLSSDSIRRSISIRKMAAIHPESENSLVWFNECIDAVLNLQKEHKFMIDNILEVLKKKKENHSTWLTELMWRIQSSIPTVVTSDSIKITLFLLDIFINCIITLSGCECFLSHNNERGSYSSPSVLAFFPISMHKFLELENYTNLSQKVIEWIHSVLKWKNLPAEYVKTLEEAILVLRNNKFCLEKNKWHQLFCQPAMQCSVK